MAAAGNFGHHRAKLAMPQAFLGSVNPEITPTRARNVQSSQPAQRWSGISRDLKLAEQLIMRW